MAVPKGKLLSLQYQVGGTGPTQTLEFDASISEQHVTTAEVTQHQVEKGANVADHIRPMPTRLTLEAMISNTPLVNQSGGIPLGGGSGATGATTAIAGGGATIQFSQEFDRVHDCYDLLRDLELAGTLFIVNTTLLVYTDMAIINMSVPRSAASGDAIQFTVELQEIRIVTTQTVQALPAKVQPTKYGPKPAKPIQPTAAQKPRSTMHALVH